MNQKWYCIRCGFVGRRKSKRTSKLPLKNVRSPASDEKLRRDLSNTVQQLQSQNQLIKDLDDERERRWKAEQAAGRLLHQVQLSQEKGWYEVLMD